MKILITISAFLISVNVFAANENFDLTCKLVSVNFFSASETIVNVNCGQQGNYEFVGDNNSPCLAADNLKQFIFGARIGETLQINAENGSHTGLGGIENSTDIIFASRENSNAVLEAATVIHHGTPKKCNNTQVVMFRN